MIWWLHFNICCESFVRLSNRCMAKYFHSCLEFVQKLNTVRMWQVLLAAAAAAGSTGLVAKHMFNPNTKRCDDEQSKQETNPFDDDEKYQSPVVATAVNESGYEGNYKKPDGIFRFSSPESGGKSGSKNVKKKRGVGDKKMKNHEKRSRGVEVSKRGVAVFLKERKTAKNVASKCGTCSSKDNSVFNWGLGIGIMYMMSVGKTEISKLNTAMDETAKVVQELKSELKRRKSCSVEVLSSGDEVTENPENTINKQAQQVLIKSRTGDGDINDPKMLGFPLVDDGELTNSVLTGDQDAEVVEMDQLEAELETELQKLPWLTTEASCLEDMKLNLHETSDCYQSDGVSPAVLHQKLSRLLIEQQENKIVDLESELNSAQSKLREKEAELQALKDCVKCLTQFSLSTIPDNETEAQEEQDCNSKWESSDEVELESRPVVGMKRPVES